jgi:N-acyl homoserine lactone hydrolase
MSGRNAATTVADGSRNAATAKRMYVLDGGEAKVEDISQWSPGVNVGQPRTFSNNVYLIEHGDDWMVWDTGLDDELTRIPEGKVVAHDVRGVVSRTLASQLAEVGIDPADITIIAFSHAHFDHVGNSRLFRRARWYVQQTEHDAMFGGDHEKYGFLPHLYETMKQNETVTLGGDHDIFGDGSVCIISTPGHTPGHQSLLVRLPGAGAVILSGDVAHFRDNLCHRRVPAFNADKELTRQSMDKIDALTDAEEAQLLINHDAQQNATIRHAPQSIR